MDPPNNPRPSGLPRPVSRLPVPRAGVRPSPSRETLQQQPPKANISNPRLRNATSREQISSSTAKQTPRTSAPTASRDREASTGSILHPTGRPLRKPSSNALFRKPSKPVLQEQEQVQPDSYEEGGIQQSRSFSGPSLGSHSTSSKSRPSLSERTMETLQNIPPSPAIRRRESDFFNDESPVRAASHSSRPGSSSQNDVSMGVPVRSFSSGPSGSSNEMSFKSGPQSSTPAKRLSTIKSVKTPSSTKPPSKFSASHESPSSPVTGLKKAPAVISGSKSLVSRPLKPRASATNLFRKPSISTLHQTSELDQIGFDSQKPARFSNASSEATSTTSKASRATTATTISPDQDATPRKSSSALRDQIAKAKAAKRAAASKTRSSISPHEDEVPVIPSGTFDFGLSDDPFNLTANQGGAKGLLRKRIDSARSDGRLNIAAMGLKKMPEEVLNMYNFDSIAAQGGSWAESVDLTRFVAADNEFEVLDDEVFPDVDPQKAVDDEDARGNQFGGLETLDLHGNVLVALPPGLRRLEVLTTLNLSNNKLTNDCFGIISQISSLRDLKISGNGLTGPLNASITKLHNLEVLDIQRNTLEALPEGLAELVRLRVINIAENRFTSLPFEVLSELPLIELVASKNNLTGVLIDESVESLPQLQILNVTSNSLTEISSSGRLKLPALHQLSCSSNRITSLPDMTSWLSLLTLTAEDNNISMIPEGFAHLPKIKNVDLSGNNLKVLDDRIGGMETLDILRISGNPLREKKFAGMTTEDLKRALKARMEPVAQVVEISPEDGAFFSAQASPNSSRPPSTDWLVKPGGILDRSNTKSYSLNPVAAAHTASNNAIKTLELHHNVFKEIPSSIAFFAATLTSLSMAHNELSSDTFLIDELELPVLKELNLSSNTFNSLAPLIQRLRAPELEKLDISFNRLTFLPTLKPHFPKLWTLLASNNTIRELSPESVKGLRVLDCSSNEISSLNARIGLLGGPGGLVEGQNPSI